MDDAKKSRSHFRSLKDSFLSRLAAFRKDREKENQRELEADFNNVLQKWGIASPENLGEVIFCLRARLCILAALPLLIGVHRITI